MSEYEVVCRQIADEQAVGASSTWDTDPIDIGTYTMDLASTSPMTLQIYVAGTGCSVSAKPMLSIDGTYIFPTGIGEICTSVPGATQELETRYMFGFNTPCAGNM